MCLSTKFIPLRRFSWKWRVGLRCEKRQLHSPPPATDGGFVAPDCTSFALHPSCPVFRPSSVPILRIAVWAFGSTALVETHHVAEPAARTSAVTLPLHSTYFDLFRAVSTLFSPPSFSNTRPLQSGLRAGCSECLPDSGPARRRWRWKALDWRTSGAYVLMRAKFRFRSTHEIQYGDRL